MESKGENVWNDRDHYCSGGFGPCFSDTVDHLDAAGDYCHRGRFMDFLPKGGTDGRMSEI